MQNCIFATYLLFAPCGFVNLGIHYEYMKARLDAFGMQGGYTEQENSETRRYFRVWKAINTSNKEDIDRFMDLLTTVFQNMALRVTLDARPIQDTPVSAFVDKLRGVSQLFFAPLPEAAASQRDPAPA